MSAITVEYIEGLAAQLTPSDKQKLVERLKKSSSEQKRAVDLYGAWRGKFPEDIDLDAELKEIRGMWEK
jgi:hypothetical protein